jgi:hypothetical protein
MSIIDILGLLFGFVALGAAALAVSKFVGRRERQDGAAYLATPTGDAWLGAASGGDTCSTDSGGGGDCGGGGSD